MNYVFERGSNIPLTPKRLAAEANAITSNNLFTALDFKGPNSRIQGAGHCRCHGNGEFVLLPIQDSAVQEGGKRYMKCRRCGCVSHL